LDQRDWISWGGIEAGVAEGSKQAVGYFNDAKLAQVARIAQGAMF
jgi:hypothetical protein